jgi:hypothetical protein
MLTIEQSAKLLRAVFPNYPELQPCYQVPDKSLWRQL